MKPFDLDAAKRGEPLVTRYGDAVTFVAHVPEAREDQRVVVLDDGDIRSFTESGKWIDGGESSRDLFMAPKKRIVWVNVYMADQSLTHGGVHGSQLLADESAGGDRVGGKAWPLEIEA